MYGFWRLGVHPGPVGRSGLSGEGARHRDEQEGEEERDPGDDRHGPGEHLPHEPAVEHDRGRGGAREDEQPEQERPLLAAPEGGQRVAERELAARRAGDVVEREVTVGEGGERTSAAIPTAANAA